MKAESIDRYGNFTLTANRANGDPIVSPDGQLQFLPCDKCREMEWVDMSLVSHVCHKCAHPDMWLAKFKDCP